MSKQEAISIERLNLADMPAVERWANTVHSKLWEAGQCIDEATKRKQERKLGRGFLKRRGLRFLDEVHAMVRGLLPKPTAPAAVHEAPLPPVPCVFANEKQEGDTWRRWIELRFLVRGTIYAFRADASALTFEPGTDAQGAIRSPDFAPCIPSELTASAVDACRVIALRLHAAGVDRRAVSLPWSATRPTFAAIVSPRID